MKIREMIQLQLSLFEPISIERANELLDLLNDGRKKDLFHPLQTIKVDDNLILVAHNKEHGHIFNVVDQDGKTPEGMSANWRTFLHVKQDLNLE